MKNLWLLIFLLFIGSPLAAQLQSGYFDFQYDEKDGKIYLMVPKDRSEFLYVNYLSGGLGSNDIGLDRGQIGNSRVVQFEKYGQKLLLVEDNLDYRADSENALEVASVKEAFARSVLGSFPILENSGNNYKIDITSFLVSDSHGISERLRKNNEGSYKMNASKSAIVADRCKAFPQNTEFDALVTFVGNPTGKYIRTVVPTPQNISLTVHHSFVQLPDDDYKPRVYHPYSGYYDMQYKDYASPIEKDMTKRYITRHRLVKKNPTAEKSEAVEPIVYYIDAGCPEPIKSALIDGAKWWNQAFEAAGFIDAFQVKELPDGANPLDVRYNMIQWVHRSTRGWSYGGSITDPRTGEIIKGHVSLGSLRVRQDYLIMQALLSPFGSNMEGENEMKAVALARLRQLSAHEVGHTIGLAHNFSASVNDRASVMDYPHPLLDIKDRKIDYSAAYDDKIGVWDKQVIKYGYTQFPEGQEANKLATILQETADLGLLYMSDSDARPSGGGSESGHLWDNGENAVDELIKIIKVRDLGLSNFGENSIPDGTPYSELEKLFVPVYMLHRYQVEAVSKLIGGVEYNYAVKGGPQKLIFKQVSKVEQERAIEGLLRTLDFAFLYPKYAPEFILPSVPGYDKSRESIQGKKGLIMDFDEAAAISVKHTLSFMLNAERLNRLVQNESEIDLKKYLKSIRLHIGAAKNETYKDQNYEIYISLLGKAYHSGKLNTNARKLVYNRLIIEHDSMIGYFKQRLKEIIKGEMKDYMTDKIKTPPGSPIGCGHFH